MHEWSYRYVLQMLIQYDSTPYHMKVGKTSRPPRCAVSLQMLYVPYLSPRDIQYCLVERECPRDLV